MGWEVSRSAIAMMALIYSAPDSLNLFAHSAAFPALATPAIKFLVDQPAGGTPTIAL